MNIRKWQVRLGGIAFMSLGILIVLWALNRNNPDEVTYFRGGYTTYTGRLLTGAVMAIACGVALIYRSFKK
jgi:hypothetical protein